MGKMYYALAALRVAASVLMLGMVHPDEFFQSQEVMARHFVPVDSALHRELFIPWEFQLPTPNRSVIFPALVAGLPYKVLELLGVKLTGWLMLVTPRLLLCLLSFMIDAILYHVVGKLSRHQKPEIKREKQEKALLLFASSWPTLVFLCRPFSNTFETLILALCFAVLFLVNPYRRVFCGVVHVQTCLLGGLLAVGFFTRFTFPVFFFPLGVELVRQQDSLLVVGARKKETANTPSVVRRLAATAGVVLQGVSAFLTWAILFVVVDTRYFRPEVFEGELNGALLKKIARNAVIAPLNNLLYNMQYDNLELHGVHPRFTHLTVNMPMLFGPIFLVFLVRFLRYPDRSFFGSACVFFPLVCLSLAPHQEPRFMLPAIVPLHLFTALSGRMGVVRFLTKHKLGKLLWVIFNVALALFFGVLHQGGILPMLLSLSTASNSVGNPSTWLSLCNFEGADNLALGAVPLIFARTYMPPRFLLTGITTEPAFQVIDLAGNTAKDVLELLSAAKAEQFSGKKSEALLVLPASVEVSDIVPTNSSTILSVSKVGGCVPHLSMEDFVIDTPFLELFLIKLATESQ
ncbi:GPI mannosyltransferase 4 [Phytophthora megakarya]|uniref:Mannosyltransferase n=1 Tax=Phytophthora megakarya TaxID=4795 RepID=A0A225W4G2_9STRA|nr:GPI mannosyltransferase 4 [Phytophthora megakarya]